MKLTSKKITASAARLFTFALFMTMAPVTHADEYCITNGCQAAHGCGYWTLEQCRARTSGIGGDCTPAHPTQSLGDALAYQPNTRSEPHLKKEPAGR
jgi:Protein of unknown function (DUF3551)